VPDQRLGAGPEEVTPKSVRQIDLACCNERVQEALHSWNAEKRAAVYAVTDLYRRFVLSLSNQVLRQRQLRRPVVSDNSLESIYLPIRSLPQHIERRRQPARRGLDYHPKIADRLIQLIFANEQICQTPMSVGVMRREGQGGP